MQEPTIQYRNGPEKDKLIKEYLRNETRCLICKNALFKVERITPDQIMLKCENCGEIHTICGEVYGKDRIYLSFSCPKSEERT